MKKISKKAKIALSIAALVIAGGIYGVVSYMNAHEMDGFVSGNGRIEATDINIATKAPGQVVDILVNEGEFVKAGQLLATMQVTSLEAQLSEAQAQFKQAQHAVASAQAQVQMRQSDKAAMQAMVVQREAERQAAEHRLGRSAILSKEGATSKQQYDDDRAGMQSTVAAVAAAKAQVATAEASINAAKAQEVGARSAVDAAAATIERIESDLADSQLKAPRDGRVQYKVAQPGEILGSGGNVLNMIDVSDVYMSFFLPETAAGKVAIGTDVRLVLDAAPDMVIPAKVSFVASAAQFTPKTVETESERQKLMFRVKAHIPKELLGRYLDQVKTGLPGVAWIRLDDSKAWPAKLDNKVK
ncbi:MAG: HlyD family efflux transporter periplasmic adaptor subunit [Neisseriaceae bacterium]|nr:HlyD family efflux transporter periplasmic adaptor subunit [Neisseriaceae bacterium]MBP6862955.1 HlyD family efflux transporter periplasmic adaptor subunit [Neisseriaceae bacterium]